MAFDDGAEAASVQKAWKRFAVGDLQGAISQAREALEADRFDPGIPAALGYFLVEQGALEEASTLLLRSLEYWPGYAPLHWYLGHLHQRRGDVPAAASALRLACRLDPALDEAAFSLAWVLHDLGELQEAERWSGHALSIRRDAARLMQLGWLHQRSGRLEEAAPIYREALLQNPQDTALYVRLHVHLSQCLVGLGDVAGGTEVLHDGLRTHPDDADLMHELGRQMLEQGNAAQGLVVARRLVAAHPSRASGWHLLGTVLEAMGEDQGCDAAYEKAHTLDPALTEALYRRACIRRRWGQADGAAWLAGQALASQPGHAGALELMVQLALDRGDVVDARRRLVPLLRSHPSGADPWRLMASVAAARERPNVAQRWLRRALRLEPDNVEAMRALAWFLAEQGDLTGAAVEVKRLLKRVPGDAAAQIQGALLLAQSGELPAAESLAEQALASLPDNADAWRALSEVRYRQQQWSQAEWAIEQAVYRLPERADYWRHWAWVYMASGRPSMALLALERAGQASPDDPIIWVERAEALLRAGRSAAALASVDAALARRPAWDAALVLRARILAEGGEHDSGDCARAVAQCLEVLWSRPGHSQSLHQALRALGLGHGPAADALDQVAPAQRDRALREAFARSVHVHGYDMLQRLAGCAAALRTEDGWLGCAALFAASMGASSKPAQLGLMAREWASSMKIRAGMRWFPPRAWPALHPRRSRLAYIASQPHQRLLARVLAAHGSADVEVFVFTNLHMGDLPPNVHLKPLVADQLARACAANSIDVAIDAGGLHPLGSLDLSSGQYGVLNALAGRIAPVQAAWLGSWGNSGGLFDVLLADPVSVPQSHEHHYEEAVVLLEGGQWCWDPPACAPAVSPLPALRNGSITLGIVARHVRLNEPSLRAMARVAGGLRDSVLCFVGTIADDWPARRQALAIMAQEGVEAWRVRFEPGRGHVEFLGWLGQVDFVLDTFPGSGGLSLLDALWMGVPVITLAGDWSGARQGASMLASIGRQEWTAQDVNGYVALAIGLGANVPALAGERQALRQRMVSSPLLDGHRLARQIEAFCKAVQSHAHAVQQAPDGKAQIRLRAAWEVDQWLAKRAAAIELACPANTPPALSVVVVLFNQAGLTRRCLQALADQRGVPFETIVVDNGSTDRTEDLLARLRGVRVLRNGGNLGFLRAANQGAAVARGRHLVFLNNDAVLQPGALAAAAAALDADASIGALGARVVLSAGGLQEVGNVIFRDGSTSGIGRGEDAFGHAARVACDTDYCSGVFLATPLSLWQRLDGFSEEFAPAYYEDTDYCLRVWQAGFRVVVEPLVLLEHLEWGSAAPGEANARMEASRALFVQRHADFLARQPHPGPRLLDADRWLCPLDSNRRRPRILFVEDRVPHMALGAGYPRSRLMLHALRDWPVTLYPLIVPGDDWHRIRDSLPGSIEVAMGHGMEGLERFLERRRGLYDVLLITRPPNLRDILPLRERRPDLFEGMRIVYDAEAFFAPREIMQAAVMGRPLSRAQARQRIRAELALAEAATDVMVISERDGRHFARAGHRVHLLPHPVRVRREPPGAAGRRDLLFVGATRAGSPNEDGLLWWIEQVLPRLERLRGDWGVLNVVGLCTSERVHAHAGPRIRILGVQESLEPYYDAARIFVAPVRFAGGIPIKIVEAAAQGLPVVASSLLVRQLGWKQREEILGAPDAETFASAIALLLADDAQWTRQQQGALSRCRQRYDPDEFGRTLRGVLGSR